MFSIARSRRRARQHSVRTASAQPGPQDVRQAFFQHLSDQAKHKTASHSRTATSPGRTYYNPTYDDLTLDTLTSRFIPNDYRKQNELWRKIYVEDATAGPAVDLYKDMPWSDFGLLGVKDPKILQIYEDCLEAIQLESQLPFISLDFLMLGRFIPHFLFDSSKGYWSRMILHDPDYIKISPIPIPGLAPKLDLVPTDAMKQFARSKDPRDIAAKQQLSQDLLAYLLKGQEIPLDPRNTSYIARRSSATDSVGTSIYTRILDIIAYQKGLIQGSQAAVRRRLGAVRTVTVGNEDWEPTVGEINEAVEALLAAEEDPVGAVVGVRQGIEFSEAGGGSAQDILKISDEWQFITEAKMQALGINESFLSGDATYSCLTGDTLVPTKEQGIVRLDELLKEKNPDEKTPRPLSVTVDSRFGLASTKVWLYNGKAPTYRILTESGNELTGTPTHPLLVLRGVDLDFVELRDLQEGDLLCISTNKVVRETTLEFSLSDACKKTEDSFVTCAECGKTYKSLGSHILAHGLDTKGYLTKHPGASLTSASARQNIANGATKEVQKPRAMTPMLAYVLGSLTAEGWRDKYSFWFSNSDLSFLDKVEGFVAEVFGLTGTRHLMLEEGTPQSINGVETVCHKNVYATKFDSLPVCCWLNELGFTEKKSLEKEVPWSILQADASSQNAFLAAFLEGDGSVRENREQATFLSGSPELLRGIQAVLNAHGYASARRNGRRLTLDRHDSLELYKNLKPYVLTKSIVQGRKLKSRNRFGIPIEPLQEFLKARQTKTNRHGSFYKNDSGEEVCISWHKLGTHPLRDEKRLLYDRDDRGDYTSLLTALHKISPSFTAKLKALFVLRYRFTPVTSIDEAGEHAVYDLSMEDRENRSFVANGLLSSNTMETLLSVFLERVRAHREFITRFFIEDKILKPIAEINNFRRIPEKKLAHRYRIADSTTNEEWMIPTVQFSKNLRPVADREYLEILEMAQERGLPVTLKTWATFAGFDLQDELERLPEDLALRRSLREYQAATDPDYADKIQNITQESGLVVPLRVWANSIGLDIDELALAMEDDVALRRKFRQWALQASPEMPDKIRDAIEQGVPVPIAEVSSAYGLNLDKLLEVKDDDVALRVEIKKWLTAVSPEARDFLEMAQDKGIPVNLEMWAKVLGLDLAQLRTEAPEDIQLRQELTPWRNAAEGEFEGEEGGEEEGDFGELPGFGGAEEGEEEGGMPPELGLPEIPEELPGEGEEPHVLEVEKEDLPELIDKVKETHPDAEIPELPPEVKDELEEGEKVPGAEGAEGAEEEILEEELPPPTPKKRPVRKLTPEQEEKLTKSIRDVLMEALKTHKKAADTAQAATKFYKNGYFSLADTIYKKGVTATSEDVPVDLGYLLDGILPDDVIPPQGYLKSDVLEYKTVDIPMDEWQNLIDKLNQTQARQSGSWGKSLAEFLRTKSPFPTHPQNALTCVSRVRIFVSHKTKYVRIVPELSSDRPDFYTCTYYNVVRLKRPDEIDPKKLLLTDLERSFQMQLLLADPPKEEVPLPDVVPVETPAAPPQPPQVVNINIPEGTSEQVVQIMRSLPIWSRDKKFVDLRQREAEVLVKKVLNARGIGRQGRYAMQMGLLNPKKKQLAQYILARLGLIKDVSLEPDVAADIVNHLTKRVPQAANPEQVNELFMMASMKTDDNQPRRAAPEQNTRNWPMASSQLLTGHIPKSK